MQPNPASFIGGMPDNSFGSNPGGSQPPAPGYGQPNTQPQPFNPAMYATAPAPPAPGPGYGQFADPNAPQADPFGGAAPVAPAANPPVANPFGGTPFPPAAPVQGQPYQPAPYAPPAPFVPGPTPAPQNNNEPPAWATEMMQMLQGGAGAQNGAPATAAPAPGWKPSSWEDVLNKAGEITESKIKEKENQAAVQAAAEQAQVDAILQNIDQQLTYLRQYGQMPQVVNPYDDNDPGRVWQKELIGLADALNTTNMTTVNQQLLFAHQMGYKFDAQKKNFVRSDGQAYTPAGTATPIGAGTATPGGGANASPLPPIGQLRRASIGELMSGLSADLSNGFGG